ncbi:MAG: hypothetical protein MN733_09255 [Nitrososphaera sp.]|nr:hypothetical protein [Nitrososphaera sp.]
MLKTIIMLDCNICGQPFDHIAVSTQSDPMAWKALSSDVEWEAELCGWSFYRGAHHCSFCISDITFSLRQAADELAAAKNTGLPPSSRSAE